MKKFWFAVLMLMLGSANAGPTPPPVAQFAEHPWLSQVKISPDGTYIAARVAMKSGVGLVVIRLADKKITASFSMGLDRDVESFVWASPTRLVVEPAIYDGNSVAPGATGELLGVNADGTDQKYLFGYRAVGTTHAPTLIKQVAKTKGWAHVISTIPGDPEHVVIVVNNWDGGDIDSNVSEIYKLNVNNGLLTDHFKAPVACTLDDGLLADWTGAVRFAVSSGADQATPTAFYRAKADSEWLPLNEGTLKNARIQPLAFSRDNTKVYLRSDEGGDRYCLVEQTLATGERRVLSYDDRGDLTRIFMSFDQKEVVAAFYNGAVKNRLRYLDPTSPNAILLRRVRGSFPDEEVQPISETDDGSKVILHAFSDRDPGTYYLFDVKSMSISPIGAEMENIIPAQMGERREVSFKSRDGLLLDGYLTIPPGVDPKSLPLVVHPHGGPIDVADGWPWERDSQLLATHGYAVLQVNFRGSRNYGKAFLNAGAQAWGTTMIDDITDGARWAVEQGFADPKRVCIFGSSYGGYAALMSAVREADLYRCAVDFAGIYDLNLQVATTDTTRSQSGESFYREFVGETPEQLRKASPRTYIDQLKAAVMIVHGQDDERVPISQAQELRGDLDHKHYPYEWMVKSGEGHGFYSEENEAEFYTRLLAFLDQNIGPGTLATTPVASPINAPATQ